MAYAVVDIETNGAAPGPGTVTELALRITDGRQVLDRAEWLICPESEISPFVQRLTGIRMEDVAGAPVFSELADEIASRLEGHVLVAHNAAFDHTYLQREFENCGTGYKGLWKEGRLCTVQLARKVWPGQPSYSLGNICASLGIAVEHRHRAGGDAEAALELLHRAVAAKGDSFLQSMVRRRAVMLPAGISPDSLPEYPGIYYFLDAKGKPIYIGKAIHLRKRIVSHFSRQGRGGEWLQRVAEIRTEPAGNELAALLLEYLAILKHKPEYNVQGRFPLQLYHLFVYHNRAGNPKLAIARGKKPGRVLQTFRSRDAARDTYLKLLEDHAVCPVFNHQSRQRCAKPDCYCRENAAIRDATHADRMGLLVQAAAIGEAGRFSLFGSGRMPGEKSLLLMQGEQPLAFGFVPEAHFPEGEEIPDGLQSLPDAANLRALVAPFLRKYQSALTQTC
jgi:DNA polymerase-3 subunit epsilon